MQAYLFTHQEKDSPLPSRIKNNTRCYHVVVDTLFAMYSQHYHDACVSSFIIRLSMLNTLGIAQRCLGMFGSKIPQHKENLYCILIPTDVWCKANDSYGLSFL